MEFATSEVLALVAEGLSHRDRRGSAEDHRPDVAGGTV